jgi:hypothetical protein
MENYRYQKDWSIGGEMFHVRCDDWNDFILAVENMETIVPKASFPNDKGEVAVKPNPTTPEAPTCGVHGTTMVWHGPGVSKKTNKPYNGFWTCPTKNIDNSFCSYRPTKNNNGASIGDNPNPQY